MKELASRIGSAIILVTLLATHTALAAYIIEVDTDGADDGVLTYNSHFSFGGGTTAASQSGASTAFGMTGGDSIFGGNGAPDTYVFTYNPSVDADNLAIPVDTQLGEAGYSSYASGLTGGSPGIYSVYATWPWTSTVSGGLTQFSGSTSGDTFVTDFDQNGGGIGTGHYWYKVGEINWTSGAITVTMTPEDSSGYVSMRAAGMLFEYEQIPEPSVLAMLGFASFLMLVVRRRLMI
jgi:hypothetical protein